MRRYLPGITGLYLVALLIFWVVLHHTGDHFWLGTILLFSPRWFLALPLLVLVPLTLILRPKWTPWWSLHALIVLFPICDFRMPMAISSGRLTKSPTDVSVMTCNMGEGQLNESLFWETVDAQQVDLIAIQECSHGVAEKLFKPKNWHFHQWKHLAIGSRYPIESYQELVENAASYRAAAAMSVFVKVAPRPPSDSTSSPASFPDSKAFPLRFCCIHLPTPRPGFEAIAQKGTSGIAELERMNTNRIEMAKNCRDAIQHSKDSTIIAGDFNAPIESHLLQQFFGDFQNAFSEKGVGLGWSKQTRLHGLRIDHILHDRSWGVVHAQLGPNLGGDHRPMIARLARLP